MPVKTQIRGRAKSVVGTARIWTVHADRLTANELAMTKISVLRFDEQCIGGEKTLVVGRQGIYRKT